MNSLQLLRDLSEAFGPSGFEEGVIDAAMQYMPAGYETARDSAMNLYIKRKGTVLSGESDLGDSGGKTALPTVLLDAHSDEIGLIVQAVRPNGTMSFLPLGGWIPATLSGSRVRVRNRDGELVSGVIAAKMHHFGGAEEGQPKLENMVIDIGAADKNEAEEIYGMAVGCPVIPHSEFERRGNILLAKAFDDRAGCAAVLEVLDAFKPASAKGKKLGVNLVGAFSSQEEVGIRGAKIAANRVKPHLAICFEGAPADDTLVEPALVQTRLGGGPMLRHIDGGMITNPRLMKFALGVAEKANIRVQQAVRARGSTNGSWYHLSHLGVPTLVISCPVRYAHSHHSMMSLADYTQCVKLAVEVVKELNEKIIRGF